IDATISSLNYFGGSGGNTFTIDDTPATHGGQHLDTGPGNDTAQVHGTSQSIIIDLGGGAIQNITFGGPSSSLDRIGGDVQVFGNGVINARLSDEASVTPHSTRIGLGLFGNQVIDYDDVVNGVSVPHAKFTFGNFARILSTLTYQAGAGDDAVVVTGNPV